jgi:hypothetical protein
VDEAALARARRLTGLKGYADVTVMPTGGALCLVGAALGLGLSA